MEPEDFVKYGNLSIFRGCVYIEFTIASFIVCLNKNDFTLCFESALRSESVELMNDLVLYLQERNVDISRFQNSFFRVFDSKFVVMGLGHIGSDTLTVNDLKVMKVFLQATGFIKNVENMFLEDLQNNKRWYFGVKNYLNRSREIWKIFFPWFTSNYYNAVVPFIKLKIEENIAENAREKYLIVAEDILTIHPLNVLLFCFDKKRLGNILETETYSFLQMFELLHLSDITPCKFKFLKTDRFGASFYSDDGVNWKLNSYDYDY